MKSIRQRAHATTIFALFWTLFSAGAIASAIDAWKHGTRDYGGPLVAAVVLAVHIASIMYAVHLWKTEQAVPTYGVEGSVIDDLLDTKPEEVDLVGETARLKRIIIGEISTFLCLMLFAWLKHMKGLVETGVLFSGILLLHILAEIVRYSILRRRARASSGHRTTM